jgi:hypothetical protein
MTVTITGLKRSARLVSSTFLSGIKARAVPSSSALPA